MKLDHSSNGQHPVHLNQSAGMSFDQSLDERLQQFPNQSQTIKHNHSSHGRLPQPQNRSTSKRNMSSPYQRPHSLQQTRKSDRPSNIQDKPSSPNQPMKFIIYTTRKYDPLPSPELILDDFLKGKIKVGVFSGTTHAVYDVIKKGSVKVYKPHIQTLPYDVFKTLQKKIVKIKSSR